MKVIFTYERSQRTIHYAFCLTILNSGRQGKPVQRKLSSCLFVEIPFENFKNLVLDLDILLGM